MTGIPIVAIGNNLMYDRFENEDRTYEIPSLIDNGNDGYFADSISDLTYIIKLLLNNYQHAQQISKNGRLSAISFFNKDLIKSQWRDFLKSL